ncbi:MAG: TldD/PmbA family protein [Desulfurococcales archaeon]|nr:TldD/PmbA family protein [Desulfurococcales archaeon]
MDQEILGEIVDLALSSGASYAEARYHSIRSFTTYILNNQVLGASYGDSEGVSIRVLVNGGLGFASTSIINKENLIDTVKKAVSAARASSMSRRKPITFSPERPSRIKYKVLEKIPLNSIPDEDKIEELKDIVKSVELNRGPMKVTSYTVSYEDNVEEKMIINSEGALVESITPRVEVFYNISASAGDRNANRWNQLGVTGGLEALKNMNLHDVIDDDVNSLYINIVKAQQLPSKSRMDVVLSPEIVALSTHEAAGHPSEADRVLGREAAQAGLSYRKELKEGYKIGSEHVTIIDDPTIPGSYGFYLVDDEGVQARPKVLIEKGVLKELLHNRETASVFGVNSNASARAMDYRSEPIVRMSNTYLAPGDYDFEELVEDVNEGIYMKKYMEWNIDDYRWGARYVGLEAYYIKNGRIMHPLRNVVLEITTKEYYSSIDAVGKDLTFYAGTCGKGEPPQPLPVWMGGPHVRLRNVEVK